MNLFVAPSPGKRDLAWEFLGSKHCHNDTVAFLLDHGADPAIRHNKLTASVGSRSPPQ